MQVFAHGFERVLQKRSSEKNGYGCATPSFRFRLRGFNNYHQKQPIIVMIRFISKSNDAIYTHFRNRSRVNSNTKNSTIRNVKHSKNSQMNTNSNNKNRKAKGQQEEC